jgi:hypothetical protein
MSLLSHQSAVNEERDYWLKAAPGLSSATQFVPNPLPYNFPFIIDQDDTAPSGDIDAQASIIGAANQLFIQSPTAITIKQNGSAPIATQINTDATAQNFLPGILTSTTMVAQGGFVGTGLTGRGLTLQTRDADNNFFGQFQFNTPQSGVGQSTLSVVYLNENAIAPSNVMFYDPSVEPAEIRIPSWNLSTSALNVSSINGGFMPPNSGLVEFAEPVLANGVYGQTVSAIGTAAVPGGLVANAVYQYDVAVNVVDLVANNAGSAPTFPFCVKFGVRLGGTGGTFDYGYTVPIYAAGGSGPFQFVLSGMVKAASPLTNDNLDVVLFFSQIGTTVTATFAAGGDPTIYLKRLA